MVSFELIELRYSNNLYKINIVRLSCCTCISDPLLVTNPLLPPANFVQGEHPYWETFKKLNILVDPYTDTPIGFWDTTNNLPFLIGKGYLRTDPEDTRRFKFVLDPLEDPFPRSELLTKTKANVTIFTQQFDATPHVNGAPDPIPKIVETGSLVVKDYPDKEANQKAFVKWYLVI